MKRGRPVTKCNTSSYYTHTFTSEEQMNMIRKLMNDLNLFIKHYEFPTYVSLKTRGELPTNKEKQTLIAIHEDGEERSFSFHPLVEKALLNKDKATCASVFDALYKDYPSTLINGIEFNSMRNAIKIYIYKAYYLLCFRACTSCKRFVFYCLPMRETVRNKYTPNKMFESIKDNPTLLNMNMCAHEIEFHPHDSLDVAICTAEANMQTRKHLKLDLPVPIPIANYCFVDEPNDVKKTIEFIFTAIHRPQLMQSTVPVAEAVPSAASEEPPASPPPSFMDFVQNEEEQPTEQYIHPTYPIPYNNEQSTEQYILPTYPAPYNNNNNNNEQHLFFDQEIDEAGGMVFGASFPERLAQNIQNSVPEWSLDDLDTDAHNYIELNPFHFDSELSMEI